jgi:hypothetical protein
MAGTYTSVGNMEAEAARKFTDGCASSSNWDNLRLKSKRHFPEQSGTDHLFFFLWLACR